MTTSDQPQGLYIVVARSLQRQLGISIEKAHKVAYELGPHFNEVWWNGFTVGKVCEEDCTPGTVIEYFSHHCKGYRKGGLE